MDLLVLFALDKQAAHGESKTGRQQSPTSGWQSFQSEIVVLDHVLQVLGEAQVQELVHTIGHRGRSKYNAGAHHDVRLDQHGQHATDERCQAQVPISAQMFLDEALWEEDDGPASDQQTGSTTS